MMSPDTSTARGTTTTAGRPPSRQEAAEHLAKQTGSTVAAATAALNRGLPPQGAVPDAQASPEPTWGDELSHYGASIGSEPGGSFADDYQAGAAAAARALGKA